MCCLLLSCDGAAIYRVLFGVGVCCFLGVGVCIAVVTIFAPVGAVCCCCCLFLLLGVARCCSLRLFRGCCCRVLFGVVCCLLSLMWVVCCCGWSLRVLCVVV